MITKAFVETTKGSMTRTRYNEATYQKTESFCVNHAYPYDYGFIIDSNYVQKNCLDCYLITTKILSEGTIVDCEVIGMIEMIEDGEIDHKILLKYSEEDLEESLEAIYRNVKDHIEIIFIKFPEVLVKIGGLIGKDECEAFIKVNMNKE